MKKPIYFLVASLLLLGCVSLIACGGGGEKQAGEEPASKPAEETVVADKGDDAGGSEWKDIPIYSGATRHEGEMAARMSTAMSGMSDKGTSEVRLFKTGDEFEKVVSYYRSQMPRQEWVMIVEKKDEGGWNSMWQKKGGQILVSLTVVKDMEGECGIVIGQHKGK